MSQVTEGLQPTLFKSDKANFSPIAKFSGNSQQPKLKRNYFLYLLNEKTEFIPFGEM